jgi:excisionase family DNA binding protein
MSNANSVSRWSASFGFQAFRKSDGILTPSLRAGNRRTDERKASAAHPGLQPRQTDPDNLTEPEKVALMNDRKTISIMKACEVVGVSRRTIYNWIASGKVEYIRTAGGSVRIFVDTLWRQPGRADLTSKEAS